MVINLPKRNLYKIHRTKDNYFLLLLCKYIHIYFFFLLRSSSGTRDARKFRRTTGLNKMLYSSPRSVTSSFLRDVNDSRRWRAFPKNNNNSYASSFSIRFQALPFKLDEVYVYIFTFFFSDFYFSIKYKRPK